MTNLLHGRMTADTEEPVVVFIIGMRINRLWAVHKWFPVSSAMRPMLQELYSHPELGFLGAEYLLQWRGVTLIQYWRSYEQLEKYARGGIHLEAWKQFNRSIGTDGTVGIFHETYCVQPGQFECIYGNMPPYGLGKARGLCPATGRKETARRRMGGDNEPAVPTPSSPDSHSGN